MIWETKCHLPSGEGKHREEICLPESSPKCSERCVKPTNPHLARVVGCDPNLAHLTEGHKKGLKVIYY